MFYPALAYAFDGCQLVHGDFEQSCCPRRVEYQDDTNSVTPTRRMIVLAGFGVNNSGNNGRMAYVLVAWPFRLSDSPFNLNPLIYSNYLPDYRLMESDCIIAVLSFKNVPHYRKLTELVCSHRFF